MNIKKKIKIVADDKIPFLKGILEPYANIEYYPGSEISKQKITDADALIVRTRTKCNADLLNDTNVKLITTATIGYDHIDTEYCEQNGIKWLNAPGCNSTSVMQYITSALVSIAQKNNISLSERTIGIVGVGNVGKKIQRIAEIFNMNILINDPPRQREEGISGFCSINEIMDRADIITFHVPLNKEGIDKTFHIADNGFFDRLENKPIIINSSRGEVIKTESLKNAIRDSKVSEVILDVWENEPKIDLELLEMVDIATPHIAGYSADGKANGTSVCVNAVNEYFNLGLNKNWYPQNITFPDHGNILEFDCADKSNNQILENIVLSIYNIENDDARLRNSVDTFEKQRGEYPVRREYSNYTLKINNCKNDLIQKLSDLQFNLNIN